MYSRRRTKSFFNTPENGSTRNARTSPWTCVVITYIVYPRRNADQISIQLIPSFDDVCDWSSLFTFKQEEKVQLDVSGIQLHCAGEWPGGCQVGRWKMHEPVCCVLGHDGDERQNAYLHTYWRNEKTLLVAWFIVQFIIPASTKVSLILSKFSCILFGSSVYFWTNREEGARVR